MRIQDPVTKYDLSTKIAQDIHSLKACVKQMTGFVIHGPLSSNISIQIANLIQHLREIKSIIGEGQIELVRYLERSEEVQTLLMQLLFRDYELIDSEGTADEISKANQNSILYITRMDLIHILSETAMILNNLLNTPTFAQNLHQSFDLMSIMKVLLNRYFMEDFFNIEGIV